jgi:hypothetical protein
VAEHGDESWEVDALPPEVLAGIIRTAFAGVIDEAAMEAIKEREEHDKSRLQSALESLDDQEDA